MGIFDGLAMLFADQRNDGVLVLFQQLLEAEHHLGALGRRRIAPGRESGLGSIDGQLHGGTVSQFDFTHGGTDGRIKHLRGAAIA